MVSEASILQEADTKAFVANDWTSGAFATYFLLNNNPNITSLNAKLDDLITANHKNETNIKTHIQLQALKDVHFIQVILKAIPVTGEILPIYMYFLLWLVL
jgi:hypothetical protein